jgi:MMPL family
MVCVFSIFGALQFMVFKQIGVGLAAAILIDATIVRAVLLPATMKLLGDWNWYCRNGGMVADARAREGAQGAARPGAVSFRRETAIARGAIAVMFSEGDRDE